MTKFMPYTLEVESFPWNKTGTGIALTEKYDATTSRPDNGCTLVIGENIIGSNGYAATDPFHATNRLRVAIERYISIGIVGRPSFSEMLQRYMHCLYEIFAITPIYAASNDLREKYMNIPAAKRDYLFHIQERKHVFALKSVFSRDILPELMLADQEERALSPIPLIYLAARIYAHKFNEPAVGMRLFHTTMGDIYDMIGDGPVFRMRVHNRARAAYEKVRTVLRVDTLDDATIARVAYEAQIRVIQEMAFSADLRASEVSKWMAAKKGLFACPSERVIAYIKNTQQPAVA